MNADMAVQREITNHYSIEFMPWNSVILLHLENPYYEIALRFDSFDEVALLLNELKTIRVSEEKDISFKFFVLSISFVEKNQVLIQIRDHNEIWIEQTILLSLPGLSSTIQEALDNCN